ncbi:MULTISPECIES: hypothetical protein [Pseudomonas]|uniref:hypothetical protein n=1 Tax=Pseudomonas TaxID=286 RepID=UPI00249B1319|nr:hypothetical protein [Pseudomonas sp. PS01302]
MFVEWVSKCAWNPQATHFLTRKLNGVSAEMSLNVLAYNLKRVMKIIGTEGLLKAMAT